MRPDQVDRPALFLHSTTPDLRTLEGDLDALIRGGPGGDFTTYKEARSVYLAHPGDVVVGRTRSWKAACAAMDADAICLDDTDHYYLSHALLHLAERHQSRPVAAIDQMVACVRDTPRVVRLYAFEIEMQIFLLWLAREAGLEELALEANRSTVAAAWNRKCVLHPTVAEAVAFPDRQPGEEAMEYLRLESQRCALTRELSIPLPALPGYTLERQGYSVEGFVEQLQCAADLLGRRYGLARGCLKASESGDGARISPGIDLEDISTLSELGREAASHGDDYVLEAHVTYGQAEIAGHILPTALSAHIRGGKLAPKATAQFMQGTSWKGNVLLDESSLDLFSVTSSHYRCLRQFVCDFQAAVEKEQPGLVLAGIDFAIGTVGGVFGEIALLGVQDLNVSFTGAECLRAFLEKAGVKSRIEGKDYGITRIYKPTLLGDHQAFLRVTRSFDHGSVHADTIASIPGRWAMVGITGADPRDAIENLNRLQKALDSEGLIMAS